MPPRKKAAPAVTDSNATPDPPTTKAVRSSARLASQATAVVNSDSTTDRATSSKSSSKTKTKATPKPKPASKAVNPASKARSKRTKADASDNEDDAPASKKPKIATVDEEDEEGAMDVDTQGDRKMVTILQRGAAPVDPHSGMVATHQVYAGNGEVWDATLNQTDLSKNANKFYVLQLLHPIGNDFSCVLFTRWGRVGEIGSSQRKGPFPATTAISEFKKQFKSKTATNWEVRRSMTSAKSGKYMWIERSFGNDEEEEAGAGGSGEPEEEIKIPEPTLDPDLQTFCKLIFNSEIISNALSEMNYDANKLPLGKLAKSTILSGFSALKELSEVISQPDSVKTRGFSNFRAACEELTSRYYSIIPHAFGRSRPPPITTLEVLKKELDLVDALGDMGVASKLIADSAPRDADGNVINPLDAQFRSLQLTGMIPIDRRSSEFANLQAYARDTHGVTHGFRAQIECAFRVDRQEEAKLWNASPTCSELGDGDRLLLWHGSRSTNFAGILKEGLRIAPPEAPVTGYMFGKGVYFADMMSKSANYCHSYLSGNVGVLLLCEVAVKPWLELTNAHYDADKDVKNAKKLATKGVGRTQPLNWKDAGEALGHDELKGCLMPNGKCADVNPPGAYLQYNEYIVYDTAQIRTRYLLMVRMG
ncbi:PARP-domain-containing protein [Thelephora ganbajun]|uniref:PARP-domain-containing protein n=1 Tax=Thelephora ganbajun TaxID=370292 RepID=A0ACB6ZR86_THEGA|nr:PARP-domain-containing protein [Thelephora ganbajun]